MIRITTLILHLNTKNRITTMTLHINTKGHVNAKFPHRISRAGRRPRPPI